jgi:UDPglucose--hexose-1-phosphate uridylyltransferase
MDSSNVAAWEQRWHPLREEWVVIAAHRQDRPWQGESAVVSGTPAPEYVETCYFCPRNARVSGARNPDYRSVYVFDNDHPCVGLDAPRQLQAPPGIYRNAPATGIARLVCYTPKHNATLAELPVDEVAALLDAWRDQHVELGSRPDVRHVLIFENKGDVVGVSNPHPHGQIYATNFVFKTIENEAAASRRYYDEHGRVLFQDILRSELEDGRRIVFESASAVVFLPYFARYAYECYVAPKETHAGALRQPVEDVVSLRADAAPGADRWRRPQRLSFSHRVSSAPSQAASAEVPRRSGNRRRQLPE